MSDHVRTSANLSEGAESRRSWSFVEDGPPVIVVAPIFAGLLAVLLPHYLLGVEGIVCLAAAIAVLAVQVRSWPWSAGADSLLVATSMHDLPWRLHAARVRQTERDRWR